MTTRMRPGTFVSGFCEVDHCSYCPGTATNGVNVIPRTLVCIHSCHHIEEPTRGRRVTITRTPQAAPQRRVTVTRIPRD